ncbi:glycerol-3-phosphate dehydrogenase [Steroidobacter denitrificans]|uniref:Glycerol-3-phosphate dehydrogenase n=1 Tax=Steroidobacter denitrificans TaxID=465721 RepID=A0A127F7R7_STEDE|nr:glycerol-3-phosphate dehydrogenase [Steroidobacter denitrificans]AMN46493.1 glycerol-3-phosphate dehydrogenase [Steroidobacter denitrificans]
MADECVDLLIIGGGINGVGIARDAAGRGLKVALVEQADLAAATSSASTKLIHGGLRYLEFFEFRLVREALIERECLLAIAPHLIRPMQFILPHVPGLRPRWQIRLGLFLYDHLGGRKRLPASRAVRIGADRYAPLRAGLEHGFAYADCRVDDSRLVVLNALDAAERGAAIHTRTRFMSATVQTGDAGRRCWQVLCETAHGAQLQLRARAIVNAAGPWVDRVEQCLPIARDQVTARLVKGSHILLPRLFAGDHAFMLQNPDGRIVFAIPYEHEFTLVGTTDVPFQGDPADVRIGTEEIEYLCTTVNRYFRHAAAPKDVRWSYAGVRPLSDDEAANVSKVTRDYRLELTEADSHPPVLLVYGGKITTYRRLAEAALARLIPRLDPAARAGHARHNAPAAVSAGRRDGGPIDASTCRSGDIGPAWTATAALPGGDLPDGDFAAFLSAFQQRWPFLPTGVAHRLAHAYGTRAEIFLGRARSPAELGESFGAGLTRAEVDYLIAHEWARTTDDVLWRRSKLGLYLSPRQVERLAEVMAAAHGPAAASHAATESSAKP